MPQASADASTGFAAARPAARRATRARPRQAPAPPFSEPPAPGPTTCPNARARRRAHRRALASRKTVKSKMTAPTARAAIARKECVATPRARVRVTRASRRRAHRATEPAPQSSEMVSGAGTDPKKKCAPANADPLSCLADGLCDGFGICRNFAPSTKACGATTCSGTSVQGNLCSGDGVCKTSTGQDCSPSKCQVNTDGGGGGSCATSCNLDGDCAPTAFCTPTHVCLNKKALG